MNPPPKQRFNPRLRLIVSPCRSGSTALLQCLAQHPHVEAHYQAIKSGLREEGAEDYQLFYHQQTRESDSLVVDKETLGPHTAAESAFRLFPEESAVEAARPLFLFRDPLHTWNGWLGQGWPRYDLFELAWVSAYQAFLHARTAAPAAVLCFTYEALVRRPREALTLLCEHWGLAFDSCMLDWNTGLEAGGRIRGGADFLRSLAEGSFDMVRRTRTLQVIDRPLCVPDGDVRRISSGPLPLMYRQAVRDCPPGL